MPDIWSRYVSHILDKSCSSSFHRFTPGDLSTITAGDLNTSSRDGTDSISHQRDPHANCADNTFLTIMREHCIRFSQFEHLEHQMSEYEIYIVSSMRLPFYNVLTYWPLVTSNDLSPLSNVTKIISWMWRTKLPYMSFKMFSRPEKSCLQCIHSLTPTTPNDHWNPPKRIRGNIN